MKDVHLIANAHLDPVWLWQWYEGYTEVKATFRSALDRMNEFPDYKFTSACAAYYEWIHDSDPAMFEEIRQRVEEGRWCITGGWYIQPDCNIPCGESFARHGLVSQRFFRETLGKTAKVGYNVDSFGHNGSLPMILKQSGMDAYVFMRPGTHEKNIPYHVFNWKSADGSSLPTYRIPIQYNISQGNFPCFERIANMATDHAMMAFYGIGNHGGGATIALLKKMEAELDKNTFHYSTPEEYFASIAGNELPTLEDDLQYHAKGCYSACSMIKTNNRRSENMLLACEKYASLSNALLGTPYPAAELTRGWKNTLFNQFHDILCGCSIREAYDDARIQHGETQSIADRNTNFALQQISWNIDTVGGRDDIKPDRGAWGAAWCAEAIGTPIVVFNPHAWPIKTFVRIGITPRKLIDTTGAQIPMQIVRASRTNNADKWELGFIAELPPLGYQVYRAFHECEAPVYENPMTCTQNSISNGIVSLEFNPQNGELVQMTDLTTGRKLLSGETKTVLINETDSDTWSHGITEFKNVTDVFLEGSCMLMESGPVRATIQTTTRGCNTVVTRRYQITAGSNRVTVRTKVDFREHHRMLKFRFPVNAENPSVKCEIPFGSIARPTDGTESVCQSWFAMTDAEGAGLAVLNDSKYSFDADGSSLGLTVLRGAIYADHYGQNHRDIWCEYMDQGIHEFTYALTPFTSVTDAIHQAAEINTLPFSVIETFHRGALPTQFSGVSVKDANVIVTAVKKHEDSDATVLRAYECEGKDTETEITLFGTTFKASFGHNAVKTFIVDKNGARECNFLED